MRLFVAFEIPEAVRRQVDQAVAAMRPGHDELRWSDPQTWHVTLAFLGEVEHDPDEVAEVLSGALTAVSTGPVTLSLGGAGHFRRSVLWIGVYDDPAGEVARLGGEVQHALVAAGIPVDRKPVHPHLTLARSRRQGRRFAPDLPAEVPTVEAAWTVREAVLYASYLGNGPARHEPVARIAL